MRFGTIDPISGGDINSDCTVSGPKIIDSDCQNATFDVSGTNSIGDNATSFKVFIS